MAMNLAPSHPALSRVWCFLRLLLFYVGPHLFTFRVISQADFASAVEWPLTANFVSWQSAVASTKRGRNPAEATPMNRH